MNGRAVACLDGSVCAVADVKPGQATIWSASKAPTRPAGAGTRLGIPEAQLRVIYLDGAGCYGMNGHDDVAAEAALHFARPRASRAPAMDARGRTWLGSQGPPQLLDFRAALDANGNIAAWETEASFPMNTPICSPSAARLRCGRHSAPDGQSVAQIQGQCLSAYDFDKHHATVHWLKTTPLRPSNLRAPGKLGNCVCRRMLHG